MGKYKLTNKAVEDLSKIWEYTLEAWSEKQADKYYQMLISNFKEIYDKTNIVKSYNGIDQRLI